MSRTNTRSPLILALCLCCSFVLGACAGLPTAPIPTLIPTQYLPTAIAQTLQAANPAQSVSATQPEVLPPTATQTAQASPTPQASAAPTTTPTAVASALPTNPLPAENTQPAIPEAIIQIRNLGELSKVASPIPIDALLKPGEGGKVQIDLLGEDRRVLARLIKDLPYTDRQGRARLITKLDFEISAVAEAGRLVFSVFDEFERTTAVNSVPLILLSIGEGDIVPPANMQETIVIQQPPARTLIQGGNLLAYGLSRPVSDSYLVAQLIAEDGQVVGKRVANSAPPEDGGYGTFVIEVPYSVSEPTPALLVVWQGEGSLSNVIHLSSVEVLLSP